MSVTSTVPVLWPFVLEAILAAALGVGFMFAR